MNWFRKERVVETQEPEIIAPHKGEMYEAMFKYRASFVAVLIEALPKFASGAVTSESWTRFVALRDYTRTILDDWYDEPDTIDAMIKRIDVLQERCDTWAKTNADLEDSVRERLPLTADEASDIVGSMLEDLKDELATNAGLADAEKRLDELEARPPVDLTEIAEKLEIAASTLMQHRERLLALEAPAGMTESERVLVGMMQECVTPTGVKEPEHVHHWVITVNEDAEEKGTCECGADREF